MVRFEYPKDYILETDSVRLSPLTLEHIEHLQPISDDDSIWTYFIENGKGITNLTRYIRSAIENRKAKREYPFIVFDKKINQWAGMTRLYEWNESLRTIKLGHTWYGKKFQGTGLNKHCKYLLFEFAFEQLETHRIGFGVHAENNRSLKALKSVGVQKEGILREFLPSIQQEGRTDLVLLSILKDEWTNKIKDELYQKIKPKNQHQ